MASGQRQSRSEQELRDASNDLYYELWMFLKLASGLATGVFGESVLSNALLESFAIHAKVLLDFLYNDNLDQGELSALDYVPNSEHWIHARPRKTALLRRVEADVRHRAAKEIGRLTYDRRLGAPEKTPWPFMRIAKEVNDAVDIFLALVPERLLGPRWKEALEQRKTQEAIG